jgi:hypothetical protein
MQNSLFGESNKDGAELRDEGMKKAETSANEKTENWSERAMLLLRKFTQSNKSFMAEDIRLFAIENGLPKPPSERAWGAVIKRAAKSGIIKKVGHQAVSNPRAHKAFASVWERI